MDSRGHIERDETDMQVSYADIRVCAMCLHADHREEQKVSVQKVEYLRQNVSHSCVSRDEATYQGPPELFLPDQEVKVKVQRGRELPATARVSI